MTEDKVSGAEPGKGEGAEKTVFIQDELGLHARPAAKLAQAAQRFSSQITLEYEDMTVDAKSILDILSLAAGRGASLTIRCKGEDADLAAEQLERLFIMPPDMEQRAGNS
ncbi:HPr family phosphocarrier protein [Desulfovibrio sp. OttesenSCG-928-A18]|nr:HPr family phosphocarrier protein [Desulfovibrio sp. OttesenSCG-928-A18]